MTKPCIHRCFNVTEFQECSTTPGRSSILAPAILAITRSTIHDESTRDQRSEAVNLFERELRRAIVVQPRVRGGAGGEVRLGEDDEVLGLGAEAEEESPEAVVGGEDAPGAADGAGARGVERAQQAQDLGEHVGGDGVERAQR